MYFYEDYMEATAVTTNLNSNGINARALRKCGCRTVETHVGLSMLISSDGRAEDGGHLMIGLAPDCLYLKLDNNGFCGRELMLIRKER
jgi:hypothetical protein